jgi:hypothetical protein
VEIGEFASCCDLRNGLQIALLVYRAVADRRSFGTVILMLPARSNPSSPSLKEHGIVGRYQRPVRASNSYDTVHHPFPRLLPAVLVFNHDAKSRRMHGQPRV